MAHNQIKVNVCLPSTALPLRKTIQLIKNFDVTEYHNAVYVYRQERILKSSENKKPIYFICETKTYNHLIFIMKVGIANGKKSVRKFGLRQR